MEVFKKLNISYSTRFSLKQQSYAIELRRISDIEEYYKSCKITLDTLLYHPKCGIIDSKNVLSDMEQKRICLVSNENISIQDAYIWFYMIEKYHFRFDEKLSMKLRNLESVPNISCAYLELKRLLTLDYPTHILKTYPKLFPRLNLTSRNLFIFAYLKNNIKLRMTALLLELPLKEAEEIMEVYGIPMDIKDPILLLLQYQNFNVTEKNLLDLKMQLKGEIGEWFSLRRAKHLADGELIQIPALDQLEAKAKKSFIERH